MAKYKDQIVITALSGIPMIGLGDDLATIFLTALVANDIQLLSGDIIAISSKIVSKAEGRYRVLGSVNPSERAYEIAQECQKDPRLVQVILVRIPTKSTTCSGHAVHLSERSDASEIIIPSSGRHGQGRIDLAP